MGTVNVLEAARRAGAGRAILASTVWVYGATRGERVDETATFDPDTNRHPYVTTKIAAEMACRDYPTLYQRPFTILRYGIPYGPRMRENTVLASFFRRALTGEPLRIDGDGRQLRNFVYVTDLARAHVLALRPEAENLIVNVDGPEPVSIRRLAELTRELVPSVSVEFGPVRPGDLAPRVVVSDRAREVLGWAPEVGIDEGVRLTLRGTSALRAARGRRLARGRRWLTTPDASPSSPPTTRRRRSPRSWPACTRWCDELVVVDDGSTDRTRAEISAWLPAGGHARMLSFDRNRGMSAAYHLALHRPAPAPAGGRAQRGRPDLHRGRRRAARAGRVQRAGAHHAGGAARRAARSAGPDHLSPLQAARQPADESVGPPCGPTACSCSTWSPATGCSGWAGWQRPSSTTGATATARRSRWRS